MKLSEIFPFIFQLRIFLEKLYKPLESTNNFTQQVIYSSQKSIFKNFYVFAMYLGLFFPLLGFFKAKLFLLY